MVMDELLAYLNSLPVKEQEDFASRCGTTVNYLRKAISSGQTLGQGLCINIDRESNGVVRCEKLRDDTDWGYLRATGDRRQLSRRQRERRKGPKAS